MHELITAVDAHATGAETSGRIDQPSHQQTMGLQEMGAIGWIPARQRLVGGDGIANLLNVTGRTHHPLAIEQGGHLLQAEAVLLDCQRGLDRMDAVLAAQTRRWLRALKSAPATEGLRDTGHLAEQGRGERERRGVGRVSVGLLGHHVGSSGTPSLLAAACRA